ncbi:MAG: 6-pyruvoyl-tetrahydropterin synthase-related protein, partial [Acidimicrobiia bacterium]
THAQDDGDGGSPEPPPTSRAWYDRLEYWVGIAIVAACCVFVLLQLQPGLLFRNTTITGGDTGAHVWFPAFLRDHLLPWRLSGWSNDFYAGFPAGQFYFPFPAVLIVALNVLLPYNVAFKLVTALGPLALPAGAYVFGRGIRVPRPAAPLLAVAATAFMFFKDGGDSTMTFDLHIMGGTLASTFAGEYSFMIALACALFFLGTLARALDRRGPLWLPAVLLAITLTSHLVVGLFAILAGAVIWLVRHPRKNLSRTVAIGAVGVLLTSVWLLPLAATLGYTTDMRYEPIGNYLDWMFLSENWFLYPLVLIGLGAGVYYRRRATLDLAGITLATGLVFYNWEGIRAIFGKAPAWNLRLLPFWYLMLFLLAALGVAELARLTALGATWVIRGPEDPPEITEERLPPIRHLLSREATRVIAIAVLAVIATTVSLVRVQQTRDFLPYWARYNYTGYEGGTIADFTQKSWPEYRAFLDTANSLAPGRMAWEGGDAIGAYGTPLALMLLPYWTHGRIASMEGLYFEASATTPYHFMMIATLAQTPSNPVRALPYRSIADFDLGVRYLQLMGVRYYAAFTDTAKAAAARNPVLTQVATVPDLDGKPPNGWTIYEVADSPTVQALGYRPVVVDDLHADPSWKCEGAPQPDVTTSSAAEFNAWECSAVPWFNDPNALERPLTDGGPASWTRAPAATARSVAKQRLPKVRVSNIHTTESSIEFDVDRTGVPVMVKTSYFPNWNAEGADGPWRATPNFMVVVPTAKHVKLTYGTTSVEWAGRFLTLVGLVGLAGLVWWGLAGTSASDTGVEPARRRIRFPSRNPR